MGGREQNKGHMCLGRLEQSDITTYHYLDYIWENIINFIMNIDKHNSMGQCHSRQEDDTVSCEACGAMQINYPHSFVMGEIMMQSRRGYY